MSHGAGGHETSAEPDLTAMLDVVMQLLMYFIMCVNFIDQENTAEVLLPVAQMARPITRDDGDVLFLNVDKDGKVLILGEPAKDLDATRLWLDNRALEAKGKSGDGTVRTAIVVRAHRDAGYDSVYKVMQACKEKGFTRFKLRAMIAEGA